MFAKSFAHFLLGCLLKVFNIFWIEVLCWLCDSQTFSPNLWLIFSFTLQCLLQSRSFYFDEVQFIILFFHGLCFWSHPRSFEFSFNSPQTMDSVWVWLSGSGCAGHVILPHFLLCPSLASSWPWQSPARTPLARGTLTRHRCHPPETSVRSVIREKSLRLSLCAPGVGQVPRLDFYFLHCCTYLFLVALDLHCCMRAFSSCGERGLLFVEKHGL